MKGLKDKVVVVTGAAGDIGKAIAFRFGQEGSKVVIADFADGASAAEEIRQSTGAQVIYYPVDVTDFESVKTMIAKALEKFGQIDIMVNNAGINSDNLIKKMGKDQWTK